ncbi:UAA transporter, partial [Tulasnella sp. 408]
MFAVANLPSIHEKEDQKDVWLLKSSFSTSPTILLSSPSSTYAGTHHRRRSSGITKQLMASTTSLDAAHQYQWAPSVNFPPSPSATPALSTRASTPEASLPPLLPIASAPPSPSPSPPPYSVHANDRIANLTASLQKQQQQQTLGMPVGSTTTTTILDSPPSRLPKHQRPPIPLKPSALRLVSSSKTTVHSASTKGWRRFMHSGFTWIGLYFVFNMGLTLYNKTVLVHFPFPYSLTALHTLCGTIGCLWLRNIGYFTPARLTVRQNLTLAAFSVLYTLNIAVSNLSLQLVT